MKLLAPSMVLLLNLVSLSCTASSQDDQEESKAPTGCIDINEQQFEIIRHSMRATLDETAYPLAADYFASHFSAVAAFAHETSMAADGISIKQTIGGKPVTAERQSTDENIPPAESRRLRIELGSTTSFEYFVEYLSEFDMRFTTTLRTSGDRSSERTLSWVYQYYGGDDYFHTYGVTLPPHVFGTYEIDEQWKGAFGYSLALTSESYQVSAERLRPSDSRSGTLSVAVNERDVCDPLAVFWPLLLPTATEDFRLNELSDALAGDLKGALLFGARNMKMDPYVPPKDEWDEVPEYLK